MPPAVGGLAQAGLAVGKTVNDGELVFAFGVRNQNRQGASAFGPGALVLVAPESERPELAVYLGTPAVQPAASCF